MNRIVLVLYIVIALSACHDDGAGNADLAVSISALSTADVATVTVTVDGPGMSAMQAQLTLVNGSWQGTLAGIPAGTNRVFTAVAADSSAAPIYQGHSGPVTIVAAQTAIVIISLTPVNPPPSFGNHAPHIDSLVASSNLVAPGETVDLSVTATDADGEMLAYSWTTDADSLLTTPTQPATDWSTSAAGPHAITIKVSDPHQAFDALTLTILATTDGTANISITINSFPEVANLTLSSGRLMPGVQATATVTAADSDGDSLTYAWSDDCNGTWAGTGTSAQITLAADSAATTCTLRVDVTDGRGGANVGTLTVGVGSGMAVRGGVVTVGQSSVGNGLRVVEQSLTAARTCSNTVPVTCVTGGINQ